MEVIKTTPIELPAIIAGVYGLRCEEVIGIKWNAIDFKTKTLTIRHTVGRGKIDGVTQFIFKDRAKSDSGYRTLPLFDFITDLLNSYKNGVPVKDIQIWLGHSNFQTTLRYAHADIENKRISASVISDKLALNIKDTKKQITELAI